MRTRPNWKTCPHCGEKFDLSTRYTSPANHRRDLEAWARHERGECLPHRAPLRYACQAEGCTYETAERVMIKDHAAVLGHFGWADRQGH